VWLWPLIKGAPFLSLIRTLAFHWRRAWKYLRKHPRRADKIFPARSSKQDEAMAERQLDLFSFFQKQSTCTPRKRQPVAQPAPRQGDRARRAGYTLLSEVPFRDHHRFYDQLVAEMKAHYGISIRKWRKSMSGVAYELHYNNGDVRRMISAPRPRSPVSVCIFMHEVGHHAVGFRKFRPRCLEEYHVWQWAFDQMRKRAIPVDRRVERHYRRSMYHYVRLAKKRGLKALPPVLEQFQTWPA
jgi:hypothetical protein